MFFDPHNGMEPGRATEKHLRFEELAGVLARMDATSVAVVFQYGRRQPRSRAPARWSLQPRSCGRHVLGRVLGYFQDHDDHVWEVAFDPDSEAPEG